MTRKQKLFLYSSLFISIAVNSPKLAALDSSSFVARLWHFDTVELIFQTTLNFCYCLCAFYYNKDRFSEIFSPWRLGKQWKYLFINLLLFLGFGTAGIIVQRTFFVYGPLPGSGYFFRLLLSGVLITIGLRIFMLMQQTRSKEIENEQLRNSFLNAQLQLLKGQLDPHFFYNSLSSLSGIISEDPQLAKKYISHLSKFFRYSLQGTPHNIVSIKDELTALRSYVELLKMRHEDGLQINIMIEEEHYNRQLPHMSVQPLVENVMKHNIVSGTRPLYICIFVDGDYLVVKNNLQPLSLPEAGTGIGLANLNERCAILVKQSIEIVKNDTDFIVKVPLL